MICGGRGRASRRQPAAAASTAAVQPPPPPPPPLCRLCCQFFAASAHLDLAKQRDRVPRIEGAHLAELLERHAVRGRQVAREVDAVDVEEEAHGGRLRRGGQRLMRCCSPLLDACTAARAADARAAVRRRTIATRPCLISAWRKKASVLSLPMVACGAEAAATFSPGGRDRRSRRRSKPAAAHEANRVEDLVAGLRADASPAEARGATRLSLLAAPSARPAPSAPSAAPRDADYAGSGLAGTWTRRPSGCSAAARAAAAG